jgi:SAM-dependent methyltransferase
VDERKHPTLAEAWEANAPDWLRWARTPGHDSYWQFHRDAFLPLVPPPGRLTLDVGCGEGRVARDLKALGHRVIAIDSSPTLLRAARELDPELEIVEAKATSIPLPDRAADLAVAFMSLMDMDDMETAVREVARVLEPGGRFVLAVVHPINAAGTFADPADPDSPFLITESYFDVRRYRERIERGGLRMTFESFHRTFQQYADSLVEAGFVIEAVREVTDDADPRWRRIPLFLHVRAKRGNAPQPG